METTTPQPPSARWRALSLPGDPPNLERTVDRIVELIMSAQLLHQDYKLNAHTRAREIWEEDLPRISEILLDGGIGGYCYPLEMHYRRAVHNGIAPALRRAWHEFREADLRDEIRLALRWSNADSEGLAVFYADNGTPILETAPAPSDSAEGEDESEKWRSLHLPGDPPYLEETVDKVLEVLMSAQILNAAYKGDPYDRARELWAKDMEHIFQILREGGIPFPCYPLELYYNTALYSFLDHRTRHRWYMGLFDRDTRDNFRYAMRWTREIVSVDPAQRYQSFEETRD